MDNIFSRSTSPRGLMEAITLLYMLDKCPESPKDNEPTQWISLLPDSYQLPFQCEKEIVDSLAFLSATTKDSSRVMAVCIEEARDHSSCTIRLSSNTGNLDQVAYGFKLMAGVLQRAASRVSSEDDDAKALLRSIVTMDYFRILSRLRSRHAKGPPRDKEKPILLTLLRTAINDQSVQPNTGLTSSELETVQTKTDELAALFMRFEDTSGHSPLSVEVQDVVMDIITRGHELASQTKLRWALESSKLEPGLKSFLPEAIEKLSRYYSISYLLVRAARTKEYTIFRSISIETFSIQGPYQPTDIDRTLHPLTALQGVIRPGTPAQSKALRPSLEKCLEKPLELALKDFRSIVTDYYKSVKVHAEIQLLFFYELNMDKLRPRVISSNKGACYLCNLFFKLHGRFHVPRTHGRLYYKWALPAWHILLPTACRREFSALMDQLWNVLRDKTKAALARGPARANYPNESPLVTPAQLPSTIIPLLPEKPGSVLSNRLISSEMPGPSDLTTLDPLLPKRNSQAEALTATISSDSPSKVNTNLLVQEPTTPRDLPPPDTPNAAFIYAPLDNSSATTPRTYHGSAQGEFLRHQILYPNISINIGTSRLQLHLSCDTSSSDMISNPSSRCSVRVKWLQDTEMEDVNTQEVDVEDLTYDTEMRLHHRANSAPTELCLKRGEDVVSIKYTFGAGRD